jgi:3-phenylpropionate/cinnamic acid dioxygenase small subunit
MDPIAKTERLIRELHDRALIQDLLMRYGRAVDRRDVDGVAACFAADAGYDGSLGNGTIGSMLAALRELIPRYERTMHLLGTQVIEINGDTARCETYGIVYQRLRETDGPKDLVVGVCYLDELACREEGWLITKRTARVDWQRRDTLPAPLEG